MKYSPFSFSKINSFLQCPKKFKFQYIEKINLYEPNLATERGSFLHKAIECHINNEDLNFNFTLIDEIIEKECEKIIENLLESEIGDKFLQGNSLKNSETEVKFAVKFEDKKLLTTNYYNKESIFRGMIDYLLKEDEYLYIIDWKSGKISKYPQPLQLMMYVIWGFLEYPDVEIIDTSFVYIEHVNSKQVQKKYIFKRDMFSVILRKIIEKIELIEKETNFTKKESPLCNYCDYRKHGYCKEDTIDEFTKSMMKYSYKRK